MNSRLPRRATPSAARCPLRERVDERYLSGRHEQEPRKRTEGRPVTAPRQRHERRNLVTAISGCAGRARSSRPHAPIGSRRAARSSGGSSMRRKRAYRVRQNTPLRPPRHRSTRSALVCACSRSRRRPLYRRTSTRSGRPAQEPPRRALPRRPQPKRRRPTLRTSACSPLPSTRPLRVSDPGSHPLVPNTHQNHSSYGGEPASACSKRASCNDHPLTRDIKASSVSVRR
jgi:hypothetical protein